MANSNLLGDVLSEMEVKGGKSVGSETLRALLIKREAGIPPEDAKALVRYYTEQVWNKGKLDVIDEVMLPHYVVHEGGESYIETAEEHKQYVAAVRRGIPDIQFSVEDAIAEGTKVVARIVGRGTHAGPLTVPEVGELAATGTRVSIHETTIYRIEDGKLAECWAQVDWLSFLKQLGALSE